MQGNEDKTNKFTNEQLKTMQNWNLERKIAVSKTRIIEFYNEFYDKTNNLITCYSLLFSLSYISKSKIKNFLDAK